LFFIFIKADLFKYLSVFLLVMPDWILYCICVIHYIQINTLHFHIGLVIIPRPPYWPETKSRANMGRRMITMPIWKWPCIKLFITYFQHLEKRHPYWPEAKSRPILARTIWASIWKWSCSNPITGYFPGCENMDSLLPVILVIQKCLYLN
jgi:hypothetical protein